MTSAMIRSGSGQPRRRAAGGALLVVLTAAFISSAASAADLADLLFGGHVSPNGVINEQIYAARVFATITAPSPSPALAPTPAPPTPGTEFSGANVLSGTLTGRGGKSISFTGTRAEFDAFVNQNADRILEILFPSDPEGAIQGIPGGASHALDVFSTILLPPASPDELAELTSPSGRAFAPFEGATRHQGLTLADFDRFTIDGTDGSTYKLTPGYMYSIGPLQLGALLPLKYTRLDDAAHTTAYSVGLDLHAKYNIRLAPGWIASPLVGGFASVFTFESDRAGATAYIRYGGYAGASTKARIGPVFLGFGALYSISTIDAPQSLASGEVKALMRALGERTADQHVTLGGQVEARLFGTNGLASLGAAHVETVGDAATPPGLRSFTQGSVSVGYFHGRRFRADLGYKQIFGADPLRSRGVYLNAMFEF